MKLRRATLEELAAIAAVDDTRPEQPGDRDHGVEPLLERSHREPRVEWLRRRIDRGECTVAIVAGGSGAPHEGAIAGFLVDDDAFFDRTFIRLVVVANTHRRRGVANALVADAESRARTHTVFSSSHRSNTAMHALLRKRGWVESGVIEGLDEMDPEIVFRKRVR